MEIEFDGVFKSGAALDGLHIESAEKPAPEPVAARTKALSPVKTRRILAFRGKDFQGFILGALSLLAFLAAWHFLTAYRVNFYVRFVNVPSPELVFESAVRRFTIRNSFRMWS